MSTLETQHVIERRITGTRGDWMWWPMAKPMGQNKGSRSMSGPSLTVQTGSSRIEHRARAAFLFLGLRLTALHRDSSSWFGPVAVFAQTGGLAARRTQRLVLASLHKFFENDFSDPPTAVSQSPEQARHCDLGTKASYAWFGQS